MIQDAFKFFLNPMVTVFGEPKTDDVKGFLQEYADVLSDFDQDDLVEAKRHMMRTHKYRAWPTPAECLAVCEAARTKAGPGWPAKMMVQIGLAETIDILRGLLRRVELRRRHYMPETIANLEVLAERRAKELGEELHPNIRLLTQRMIGEGDAA